MIEFSKNPERIKNEQCYKKCLLLDNRDFVSFCLDKKCG